MKHKIFENWILDNPSLSKKEAILLKAHLKTCTRCQMLQSNWLASQTQMEDVKIHTPRPGFTQRWQTTLIHRREQQRSRQVRRILLVLVTMMVLASTIYMLQNNLFASWIVSAISLISSLFFSITKALAGINIIFNESPVLFYGFSILSFGAIASFLAAVVFVFWNLLRKHGQEKPYNAEN
jgi:hypothetical protein